MRVVLRVCPHPAVGTTAYMPFGSLAPEENVLTVDVRARRTHRMERLVIFTVAVVMARLP
jgi:hypothetical protein